MNNTNEIRRRGAWPTNPHNAEPSPIDVVPFGRYGAGLWTGHPIGLVIVLCVLFMGLVGLPSYRWFFLASLILGGVFGFFLWLRHR